MKKYFFNFCLFVFAVTSAAGQVKIGDNVNTINANSLLELESTNKGFLPPRIALNNLSSAAPLTGTVPAGMLVYSSAGTVTNGYYTWDGTKWLSVLTTVNTRTNYVIVKSVSDFPTPPTGSELRCKRPVSGESKRFSS